MGEYAYNVVLGDVAPGKPFMMLNSRGIYIRVEGGKDLKIVRETIYGRKECAFNDDGHHIPIVELATGKLSYMSKLKPCLVYPGEDYKTKG